MKLFAAFVGEFGWELFCFQGVIRNLSKKYDVTIMARQGHERLYQDFCKKFIPVEASNITNAAVCKDYHLDFNIKGYNKVILPNTEIVFYSPFKYQEWLNTKQDFIPYGRDKNWYDYLIHARDTDKFGTGHRNWQAPNWEKLLPHLKGRIATIGTKKGALGFEGIQDLRGIPLSELVNHIASSKWVIGESSGAMHLASLCRTNQIVLSEGFNEIRYKNHWNPFGTEVRFISGNQLKLDVTVSQVLQWI